MKKTVKRIVDVMMIIALIVSIGLAVYLLFGQNSVQSEIDTDGSNLKGNSTVVKRRSGS